MKMYKYIIKRFLLMIPTFIIITMITFFIIHLAPGGPLHAKLSGGTSGSFNEFSQISTATQESIEEIKKLYGFDRPILERYLLWLKNVVTLEFGDSFFEHRPVSEILWEKIKIAFIFGLSATLASYLICIPLGFFKAIKRGSWFDRSTSLFTTLLYALPPMILGLALIFIFSIYLNVFPMVGLYSDNFDSFNTSGKLIDFLQHFSLPFLCYLLGLLAFLSELQKKSMLDEIAKDYIRAARSRGFSQYYVYTRHALGNALLPMITSLKNILVRFLGASFVIEMLFSIPGLGHMSYSALMSRDYPVIMASLTITSVLGMISLLLTDILYAAVDPRIDFSRSE